MKSHALLTGVLGLGAGVAIGLLISRVQAVPVTPRDSDESRIQIEWKGTPDRALVGLQAPGAPDDAVAAGGSAPGDETAGDGPASAEVKSYSLPSGTHPVIVHGEEDRPFAAFAEAILPTPEQVRQLTADGYREYVQRQLDERLRALEALLGSDFDDPAREELRRFYEDWAYRKFLAHREWLAKIERAESLGISKEREDALDAAAREWALAFARLKIEHRQRLFETFGGPVLQKHEPLLHRLAKYSEVATAIRVNDSPRKE